MNRNLLVVSLLALCAACTGEVGAAASSPQQNHFLMGNKGPYTGRADGIGFDLDNYGAGLVSYGEIGPMLNSSQYVTSDSDFLGAQKFNDTSGTDDIDQAGPWESEITGTTPTVKIKADYDNGAVELLLTSNSEIQDADLNWGDELNIDSDTEPFCYFRWTQQVVNAAADTVAIGLSAARNDLISGLDTFAAFSVGGADLNIDVQSDDGTTDVNATDSTYDLVAGTMIETLISMNSMHNGTADKGDYCSPTNVCFFYRAATSSQWTRILPNTTFSVGTDLAMQPFAHVEKTSGTTTPDILIDRIWCSWQRE